MSGIEDPEERRAQLRVAWDRQSRGWERQADRLQSASMVVSTRMLEQARLQPGQRVLELAAGPGDTGFLAAEMISPGGELVSSDASEGMLEVARARAAEQRIENVEFKQLELEWIDEPTASFDVVLCRWGVMLTVDPAAALGECRRVLRPGGRIALSVWDAAEANPAMTVPGQVLVGLGMAEPPPAGGPGPFALSAPGALAELMGAAGFLDVTVEPVAIVRRYESVRDWLGEMVDLSMMFAGVWRELDGAQRDAVLREAGERTARYAAGDGSLALPGLALVGAADA